MVKLIASMLAGEKIEYKENYSLRSSSTFKIGGRCSIAVFPSSEREAIRAIGLLDRAELRAEIVGKCSNILFADGDLETAIVFTEKMDRVEIEGDRVRAECGASLAALSHTCAKAGLSGLEFACGIPGSIGGAVYMNAGAYGGSISDVLESSLAYDRDRGERVELSDHRFAYRHSVYSDSKSLVCLGASFKLCERDADIIKAKNAELLEERRAKQPIGLPSAGSYFKRPEGFFAAKLIDELGLKGTRIGDAAVSEKHAGFIVNLGNASFDDVMRLEELIKSAVLKEYGVELCREVRVIK